MKHATRYGLPVLCLSLSIACGGDPAEPEEFDQEIDIAEAQAIVETGCLTSSDGRYVLTALEPAGPISATPATELYALLGDDDELRGLVGREVRVTGAAEPAQVAEVVELSPPAPLGTSGAEPKTRIEAQAETRLETREMRVATITATGGTCPAGAGR